MAGNQDAGNGDGVKAFGAKAADDDRAGIADIGLGDLFGGEGFGDRNRAMEVVGVSGAEAGNGAAGLGPGGGELGVGVDDAADLGKFAIKVVCVSRSLEGRREPSTILPSRSVTTRSAAVSVA